MHLHPIEGAPKASPESAEAGAGSSTAATDGGKAATTSVDDAIDTSGKSRAQVRRVSSHGFLPGLGVGVDAHASSTVAQFS